MDTQSIVRRIIDLKKVSVQLKQTTQDPMTSNTDLIQSLLQFGRTLSTSNANRQQKQKQNQAIQYPSLQNNPQDREPNQNQPPLNIFLQIFQNQNKKQSLHRSEVQSSVSALQSSKIYQEPLTPVQQINYLRQNNSDIQEEIRNLRDKLRRLEEIQRQERQEEWKDGLPYFTFNIPKSRIFYTKLTIQQRDYDKIDYCMYSVNLNLQKIILTQLPQTQISNRPPKTIILMLTDLKEVSYHNKKNIKKNPFGFSINQKINKNEDEDLLIVYHFKHKKVTQSRSRSKSGKKSAFSRPKVQDKIKQEDDEIVETLFMKFDTEDELKQWDLGVFINYKIMEDLNKGQAKVESSMNSSTIAYEQPKVKKQNENQKVKNAQFNQLVQRMKKTTIKRQQTKTLQSENESDDEGDEEKNGRKPPSLEKDYNDQNDDKIDSPIYKNKGSNIKIVDEAQILESRESMEEEIINKQRSNTSHFGGLVQAMNFQEKAKQAEQQKIQEDELRKQKLAEIEENKRKQVERMEELKKTQYQLSLKKAKQSLLKGYQITKYAKSAFSPHLKKLYLHEDGKRLCWKNLDGEGEIKFVMISQVVGVNQAIYGKGMETHIPAKKFNQSKGRYAVITLNSKDRKNIDLSTKDERTTQSLCRDLQLYRKSLLQVRF